MMGGVGSKIRGGGTLCGVNDSILTGDWLGLGPYPGLAVKRGAKVAASTNVETMAKTATREYFLSSVLLSAMSYIALLERVIQRLLDYLKN